MSDNPIILPVDDDIAAVVTADMLDFGYDGRHVECGQAALDYISGEIPDLVLLDIAMPCMLGYEAGSDDYLTNPVLAEEIRSKVKMLLERYIDCSLLMSDLPNVISTAMTALSSAAEIGTGLQFLPRSHEGHHRPDGREHPQGIAKYRPA